MPFDDLKSGLSKSEAGSAQDPKSFGLTVVKDIDRNVESRINEVSLSHVLLFAGRVVKQSCGA